MTYSTLERNGKQVKLWVQGVPVEHDVKDQLLKVSDFEFVWPHVAAMPDVHLGHGAAVGSVIPSRGAIIPSAVGVDIGCGMAAYRLTLKASDLPDSMVQIRALIEAAVPVGKNDHGQRVPKGIENQWYGHRTSTGHARPVSLKERYEALDRKYPKISSNAPVKQIGTLGGGNHFIEVCIDENQDVWLMLHSGSRNWGNRIGTFFISKAREELIRKGISIPDMNLAWLSENEPFFDDYVEAVGLAQDYAATNRAAMLVYALEAMAKGVKKPFTTSDQAINCHHNYVSQETHFGEKLFVTRKGAVNAGHGIKGIVPGSMGTRSYIVEGLGNPDSFCSCSHGAGRTMSRTAAKKRYTLEDMARATEGVECRKDEGVIDEIPYAYKDIDAVMAAQGDLVRVLHTLKQVMCIKG